MASLASWLGALAAAGIMAESLLQPAAGLNLLDSHGLLVVLGGSASALLISAPAAQILSALRAAARALASGRAPSCEEVAAEIGRLSRLARAQGGLLALRGQSAEFAEGFLERAISAAAACAETSAARQILELEVRRRRALRREDENVFRTLGALAPMFGLMGTLLGMLKVLAHMSDPAQLGPAMALALSSAFVGIALSGLLCLPVAGQIRALSLRETAAREMMIEGVLAIAAQEPTYQVELRMGAYLDAASAGAAREPA